jgi:shikimate dehydrogenase
VTVGRFHLGIIGRPAAHSLSPAIHRAALVAAGLSGTYTAWDVDESLARQRLQDIRSGTFDGCNVTMPYKSLAFDLVDDHSDLAIRTEAVNTVTRSESGLTGHNTDVAGVIGAWDALGLPGDDPVLILGAGGAAAAAVVALTGREIIVSARSEADAEVLLARTAAQGRIVPWGSAAAAVVVNATPIGMAGEQHVAEVVDNATGWFEMVYAYGATDAERRCLRAGKPVVSGTDMLIYQAVAAFELWTGVKPDAHVMVAALRAETHAPTDPQ